MRLAVPNTVTRMDRPSEPPTCCMTLSRLDAAPARSGHPGDRDDGQGHEEQAAHAQAEQQHGAEDPVDVAAGDRDLGEPGEPGGGQESAAVMRRLGLIRGSERAANWEVSTMAPVMGRKARPARNGLQLRTFWTNRVRKKTGRT